MARIDFIVHTGGEVSLVAATAKTVLQTLAPTGQRIVLKGLTVSFDGTSGSAEPVLVELVRQSTAGTMSSATVAKRDTGFSGTLTGQKTATVEPTTDEVLRVYDVHPQTGFERPFASHEEIVIEADARLGLRCTAPANVSVTASFDIGFENINIALQALPASLTAVISTPCSVSELFLVNVTDVPQTVSIRNGAAGLYLLDTYTINARDFKLLKFDEGVQFSSDVRWIAGAASSVNGSIRGTR